MAASRRFGDLPRSSFRGAPLSRPRAWHGRWLRDERGRVLPRTRAASKGRCVVTLRIAVLLAWCISAAALASCAALGPAEQTNLEQTSATLLRCQNEGRACAADGGADAGCYSSCMKDAGL